MSARGCCREAAGWVAPGLGLALIPKCPGCVAAYVAAITGAGISIPMAAQIRLGLLFLCVAALVFVAARAGARLIKWCQAVTPSGASRAGWGRSRKGASKAGG